MIIVIIFANTVFNLHNSSVSVNIESFNDLLLSFPSDMTTPDISMQDLIQRYLEPERFHGENKYHCKKCGGLVCFFSTQS
jgi:ubiquitin C-terminal hydrolase